MYTCNGRVLDAPEIDNYAVNLIKQRDLRALDFVLSPVDEPNVTVRRHVVVITFDPLRVLVMADRLLLVVPDGILEVAQALERYFAGMSVCPFVWLSLTQSCHPVNVIRIQEALTSIGTQWHADPILRTDGLRGRVHESLEHSDPGPAAHGE